MIAWIRNGIAQWWAACAKERSLPATHLLLLVTLVTAVLALVVQGAALILSV